MKTLAELRLRPQDKAAIDAAVRILRERFPVEQVILFGSKARGDDDPESDIDLLILTRRPLTRPEKNEVLDSLYPLQLEHEVMLTPLIIPFQEWESGLTAFLPIHREVEEQGIVI
jgi:predicted nucleotidyltransferase